MPKIPKHISLPEKKEDWLSLRDLEDGQLERRVIKEKKGERQNGKHYVSSSSLVRQNGEWLGTEKERFIGILNSNGRLSKVLSAVYIYGLTLNFRSEETNREKARLKALEEEEAKRVAVELTTMQRGRAMACCAALGFTLENTEGVDDIKPKALGMKGIAVDFDAISKGENRSDIEAKARTKRVDLSAVPEHNSAEYVPTGQPSREGQPEDFIHFDIGKGQDHETLNYNYKLRRKLRRAIEHAKVHKELLVRQRALDYYGDKVIQAPAILFTHARPTSVRGQRILENGTLETAKQERVRARMELAEFNMRMRVLRGQAKDAATYAGLRKHAEVTGRIALRDMSDDEREGQSERRIEHDLASEQSPATGYDVAVRIDVREE